MWPKVIAQLFELLPHVSRLLPLADKFLNSKAAAEKANEAALAAMAEGVRGDLSQVTKAHTGLYRQLQEQSAQISEVSNEVKAALLATEQTHHRMEILELKVKTLSLWIKVGISLIVVLVTVVIILLIQIIHVS
jgi:two-component sensor histidine kinase